jgi:hypothetical protein
MFGSQSLIGRDSVFSDTLGKLSIVRFLVRSYFALAFASGHFLAWSLSILILFNIQIGTFEILRQFQVKFVVLDDFRVSLFRDAP